MIEYAVQNRSTILEALVQHIWLSLLPVVFGAVLALPIGYLAVRYRWLYQPVVNTGGVLYSIPSLALFVVLPAILGTGVLSPLNVVVALTIYTMALLTRTVADALTSVQGEATRAAYALGYRPLRLRVATVANISLVSVGALVGVGGLGALFTRGLQLDFIEPILIGIILSVLLAAVCDLGIVLVQRWLTPWARLEAR
jgi:osmoprotectant transport system permease protein